jgi:hypothetical protein
VPQEWAVVEQLAVLREEAAVQHSQEQQSLIVPTCVGVNRTVRNLLRHDKRQQAGITGSTM